MARPPAITSEVLSILKECFLADMNDLESCETAGICDKTLDNYEKKHPEFLRLKRQIRKSIKLKARINVANEIQKGNMDASKYYLDRRDNDYKPSSKTDVNLNPHEDFVKLLLEKEKG